MERNKKGSPEIRKGRIKAVHELDNKLPLESISALGQVQSSNSENLSEADIYRLIHELEVQGIEIELQKEELQIAERKIHTFETPFRRLFESAKDGILILDAESGQIVEANPYLIDLIGSSREEILGKELWEIGTFKNIAASKESFAILQNEEYIRFEDMPLDTREGEPIEVEFISNVYT